MTDFSNIDGITLLHTIEHAEKTWGFSVQGIIFLIIGIIGAIIFIKSIANSNSSINTFGFGIILCILGLLIGIISLRIAKTKFVWYSYEVLIDDSISLVEFDKEYEILNRRDMIYEIRVRNEVYD